MEPSIRSLRLDVFSKDWPLDQEITAAASSPSLTFLKNPASQSVYIYLTRFVRALSEHLLKRRFSDVSILDWGCGKGHVSKLLRDLGTEDLESCDIVSDRGDSAFGQDSPILREFNIQVTPLKHEYKLPYKESRFDAVISMGVLEHVPNDRESLAEIWRVLKPGGLFFCFHLPNDFGWVHRVAHLKGDHYHDRLYNEQLVQEMMASARFDLVDLWYRQIFPKNSVNYPNYRMFERVDQFLTERTPLRRFATDIEFVGVKH